MLVTSGLFSLSLVALVLWLHKKVLRWLTAMTILGGLGIAVVMVLIE
jgi:hypothetical protein